MVYREPRPEEVVVRQPLSSGLLMTGRMHMDVRSGVEKKLLRRLQVKRGDLLLDELKVGDSCSFHRNLYLHHVGDP